MAKEPTRQEKLVFIIGELHELMKIAASENLDMLVYMLDMARIEAEDTLNGMVSVKRQ
ncbi:hypothetical protein [Brucella sp. IR073]|uniref:hypothetical protein n=1 Tax=unclassified Brucella TaxID=2632610 RepID=UPI003B984724